MHLKKQQSSRNFTELGILNDESEPHLLKQNFGRNEIEFGIINDDKDEHQKKQLCQLK
jgi:hypothetical protein